MRSTTSTLVSIAAAAYILYDMVDSVIRHSVIEYYREHIWQLVPIALLAIAAGCAVVAFMRLPARKRDQIRSFVFGVIACAAVWMAYSSQSLIFITSPAGKVAPTPWWLTALRVGLPLFWLVFGLISAIRAWKAWPRRVLAVSDVEQS